MAMEEGRFLRSMVEDLVEVMIRGTDWSTKRGVVLTRRL